MADVDAYSSEVESEVESNVEDEEGEEEEEEERDVDEEMIVWAITELKSRNSFSIHKIQEVLKQKYNLGDNETRIARSVKLALKKGLKTGVFKKGSEKGQGSRSYKLGENAQAMGLETRKKLSVQLEKALAEVDDLEGLLEKEMAKSKKLSAQLEKALKSNSQGKVYEAPLPPEVTMDATWQDQIQAQVQEAMATSLPKDDDDDF